MQKTNIFRNPNILRLKGLEIDEESRYLIDQISEHLVSVMETNNWAGVSPQNLVDLEGLEKKEDFYRKVIILRNFQGKDFFQIINPSYEVIKGDSYLMHEGCGSIETDEANEFRVLNLVPNNIRVKGLTPEFEEIDFILKGDTEEIQELISYIIHEVNHTNGLLITDGGVIRRIVKGDPDFNSLIQRQYPELLPSYLEFDGKGYKIHSLFEGGLQKVCSKSNKNKKWKDILPFHFDPDYDMPLNGSNITKNGETYKISLCSECM